MGIQVALYHRTDYRYDRLIALGPQVVRLRPAPHSRTPVSSYSFTVEPTPHFLNWQQDPQGNYLARIVFPEKTDHLTVTIDLVADMAVINPFEFFLEPGAETFPFTYDAALASEIAPFLEIAPPGPLLRHRLTQIDHTHTGTIDFLVAINSKLQGDVRYIVRLEPGIQTPEETLERGAGSCRDTAWLLVQMLRNLGFAARFASGYLIQLVADQKPLDGAAGPSADFADLHAWCEVYLPGAGWIGLDPTSGLLAGEGHIPLACSPEPQSAAPISGTTEFCETVMHHVMSVRRVAEAPRVTKPFDDAAWQRLLALGDRVDRELAERDVRLTMGGEPTFVAAADPDGAEWNTEALGPTKRIYAGKLLRRLAGRFAQGPLLHYGQGKWYPGEQLPRWALSCHWRADGEPIWQDQSLLAADGDGDDTLGSDASRRFAMRLAERLQIDPEWCIPGYEDSWYYLWRERQLPINVDPLKSELKDPQERERLARVFEQGLRHVVGFALPLRRVGSGEAQRWQSGPWFFRPAAMFLLPGDSPMGYRLPLDSLAHVGEADYPYIYPQDPTEPRGRLPSYAGLRRFAAEDRAGTLQAVLAGRQRREQVPLKPRPGEPDRA